MKIVQNIVKLVLLQQQNIFNRKIHDKTEIVIFLYKKFTQYNLTLRNLFTFTQ